MKVHATQAGIRHRPLGTKSGLRMSLRGRCATFDSSRNGSVTRACNPITLSAFQRAQEKDRELATAGPGLVVFN
jgi:hypothetical protein